MRSTGMWLLILGVGAFVLPYFGLQFRILSIFGDALPLAAGGMAVAGATVLAVSFLNSAPQPQEK